MSTERELETPAVDLVEAELDDGPENVPVKGWVTLVLFAAFVVAFGTCASTFMFR